MVDFLNGSGGLMPDDLFQNLNESMVKIYPALITACYIMGFFLIVKAVFSLKKLGHKTAFMGSSGNLIGPTMLIIIGVILINAPSFIEILIETLYASQVTDTKSWIEVKSGDGLWYSSITPIISLIQVVGLFAFLRGAIILTKACNENAQPGNIPKGLMHIIGGVMAINITGTIDLINNTMGIT